ncbi:hypothetical protein SCP_0305600 [Sparassis crispa]|uniref:Uncharacterized protein n=1 Tax=Sparassis crispa TaxID=139825 RepID=A0A401GF97_9APHY|nr:hypothetical protein SCP_0305600 [Sparassis crispa]GBE80840.1 hypothetical protein SCP_0305600 [Sparassis crispa]
MQDWNLYLRSTEGTSGATDSLLATNLSTTSQQGSTHSSPLVLPSQNGLPRKRSSPLAVPPLPRNLKKRRSPTPPHSPSPSPPGFPTTPLPRNSFARYAAQSSVTPNIASVPPSPALSNMVTDAINIASQLNGSPRGTANGERLKMKRPSPLPLPRRIPPGAPRAERPSQPLSHVQRNSSSESSTSAQDVETQLTQDMGISPSVSQQSQSQPQLQSQSQSQLQSQSQSQEAPQHSQSTESVASLRSQAAYDSQRIVHEEISDFLSQLSDQNQGPPPTFRSGTLRIGPNKVAREVKMDVNDVPEGNDLYAGRPGAVAASQSRQGGAMSVDPGGVQPFGYGYSSMPLYTQAPYRSQSPSQ